MIFEDVIVSEFSLKVNLSAGDLRTRKNKQRNPQRVQERLLF